MRKSKIGLLPLYVELYDLTVPEIRPQINQFHTKVLHTLQEEGLEVVASDICRKKEEFEQAVALFAQADVDAIITLHLAYSPSLESEEALKKVECPILILDTTPSYCFDQSVSEAEIMLNHGIHGVQDMCNLLKRNHKTYSVFAGHIEHSDVIARIKKAVDMAKSAKCFQTARVGLIGEPFEGMGDFQVPDAQLKKALGMEIVRYDWEAGAKRISEVSQKEIDQEFKEDQKVFEMDAKLERKVYDRSAKTSLGIRKWIEEEKLTGFTVNFLATEGSKPGLAIMPFVECCKAMERGTGYAGEGDVITAGLVGALLQANKEVTFSEMFCPDWKNGSVFMSHMGEFNYNVASGKPFLTEKNFEFTNAENPTVAYSTMKGGAAVLVNLTPLPNGAFILLLKKGEMVDISGENKLRTSINGWFKPVGTLERFLEQYSQHGGTHHNVIAYGEEIENLKYFADYCGIEAIEL